MNFTFTIPAIAWLIPLIIVVTTVYFWGAFKLKNKTLDCFRRWYERRTAKKIGISVEQLRAFNAQTKPHF